MAKLNEDDSEYIESLLDEVKKLSNELKARQKEQGSSVADLSGRIDELAQKLSFFKENFGIFGEKQFAEGIAKAIQQHILSEVTKERERFVQEIKYHDDELLKTVKRIPSDMQSAIHNILEREMKDAYVRRSIFGWVFGILGVVACFFILWNMALPTIEKKDLAKQKAAIDARAKKYQDSSVYIQKTIDFWMHNPNWHKTFIKKYYK